MMKSRTRMLIILLASIVLVIVLYSLPKVVVSDESQDLSGEANADDVHLHDEFNSGDHIPDPEQLKSAKQRFLKVDDEKGHFMWAERLAEMYLQLGNYDSAQWVAGVLKLEGFKEQAMLIRGRAYYWKMKNEKVETLSVSYADSVLEELNGFLEKNPENLSAKNLLAEAYLTKGEVMTSVKLLKEIVDLEPKNIEAQFQLGILSIQSGQLEKGIDRFEKIIEIDSNNVKAYYWLGYCLSNTGNAEKAKITVEKAKQLTNDPEVLAALESLIENI